MKKLQLCSLAAALALMLGSSSALASQDITKSSKWTPITFGQSTDANFATNVLPEKVGVNFTYLADGTKAQPGVPVNLTFPFSVESRGGKIGNSHDGLTYFYTTLPIDQNFVLEATVRIDQFGPENGAKPAAQEGCGLLVRDILGQARDESIKPGIEEFPAASNMVMTTVITKDRKDHNHVNIMQFERNGVTAPWGNAGVQINRNIVKEGLDLNKSNTFKLRLSRTNEGFVSSYAEEGSNDFVDLEVVGADRVGVLDNKQYHVGFFASRNARMSVLDASLTVEKAKTVDHPFVAPLTPSYVELNSAQYVGTDPIYKFSARANTQGTFYISTNQESLKDVATAKSAKGVQIFNCNEAQQVNALLDISAQKSVSYLFVPSNEKLKSLSGTIDLVVHPLFGAKQLVAGPHGNAQGQGTEQSPLDVASALALVADGGTVSLLDGDYDLTTLGANLSGAASSDNADESYKGHAQETNYKTLKGSANAVFNGLDVYASYLHLEGFTVTSKPMNIAGSFNHIYEVTAHHCDDTGIWVASPKEVGRALWASHNFIENCTSFENQDPGNINADGFAVKMRVGEGNVIKHALSWGNADDGYDLFNKIEDGPNGKVTIIDSVAMFNSNNGFKLGGEGLPVAHSLTGSISYLNGMDGITDNFNPGHLQISNNVAIDNARFNYILRHGPFVKDIKEQASLQNNVSVRTKDGVYADVVNGNILEGNQFLDSTKANDQGFKVNEHTKGETPKRLDNGALDRDFFYSK